MIHFPAPRVYLEDRLLYKFSIFHFFFSSLPHRLIFAVLCWDSILLYNSQNETPFAYFANLHYDGLTSIAWTPDGRFLVVSSLEGFNSFICMDTKKMGIPIELKEVLQVEKVQQGFSFNFE